MPYKYRSSGPRRTARRMREIKTVRPGRAEIIHVETPLGIVNIYLGLRDVAGRRVERVEMLPNNYAGEPPVDVVGSRFVERTRP